MIYNLDLNRFFTAFNAYNIQNVYCESNTFTVQLIFHNEIWHEKVFSYFLHLNDTLYNIYMQITAKDWLYCRNNNNIVQNNTISIHIIKSLVCERIDITLHKTISWKEKKESNFTAIWHVKGYIFFFRFIFF